MSEELFCISIWYLWGICGIYFTDECEEAYWLGEGALEPKRELSSALECLALCTEKEKIACRSISYYLKFPMDKQMTCLLYRKNKFTSPQLHAEKSDSQYCFIGKNMTKITSYTPIHGSRLSMQSISFSRWFILPRKKIDSDTCPFLKYH